MMSFLKRKCPNCNPYILISETIHEARDLKWGNFLKPRNEGLEEALNRQIKNLIALAVDPDNPEADVLNSLLGKKQPTILLEQNFPCNAVVNIRRTSDGLSIVVTLEPK